MVRVGTSGWVYGDWRKRFYPEDVPQRRWLAYYAERFDTVELNATTYRLPKAEHVRAWCDAVPHGFRYTVKLSRLITHRRAVSDRLDTFITNYFERVACFTPDKLAQILVQFPPFLERDDALLESFLRRLPPQYRYVVEFRNGSWFEAPVRALLERLNAAFCIHDYPGLRVPEWITSASLAYVRFHGATGLYQGPYPERTLHRWAKRLQNYERQVDDVYAYFNNDTLAAAPHDAFALKAALARPR